MGAKSRTKQTRGFINSVLGEKPHYETTIRGGGRQVSGAGSTSQKAEKNANKRWEKGKK